MNAEELTPALRALSRETKVFILVNEYKLRQVSVTRLRQLLGALTADSGEREQVLKLVAEGLRSAGYREQEVLACLEDLHPSAGAAETLRSAQEKTRHIPSALRMPFEGLPAAPAKAPEGAAARRDFRSRETLFFGRAPAGMPEPPAALTPKPRSTILLADDDRKVRMVFRLKLEEKGYTVLEASDGEEAWRLISGGDLQLVVLDMKMPGLHGLEVLARMVNAGSTLPVVICTAYDRMDEEFTVATYPCLKYLTKPVSPEALAAAIEELLQQPPAGGGERAGHPHPPLPRS